MSRPLKSAYNLVGVPVAIHYLIYWSQQGFRSPCQHTKIGLLHQKAQWDAPWIIWYLTTLRHWPQP